MLLRGLSDRCDAMVDAWAHVSEPNKDRFVGIQLTVSKVRAFIDLANAVDQLLKDEGQRRNLQKILDRLEKE